MAKSLSTPALNCGRRFAADAEFLQIYELQFGAMAYTRTPMSRLFVAALSCWIGKDTLLNPKAIVEVLSPSTEGYDRGFRFAHYRAIGSLEENDLISQTEPLVEIF